LFYADKIPAPAKIVVNKYTNGHQNALVPHMHIMAMVFELIKTLNAYKQAVMGKWKTNGSMRDMQRLDQLHSFLKERHPTYLLDYNIEICKPCKGTGLDIIVTNDGKDFGWIVIRYVKNAMVLGLLILI
jgi:hypothetical protein